jgi:hypothetical protein
VSNIEQGGAPMGASFRGARTVSVSLDTPGMVNETVQRIIRRAQYDLFVDMLRAAENDGGPSYMTFVRNAAWRRGFALPELKPGEESMPAVGSNRGSDWGRDETSTAERDKDREVRTDPDIRGVEKGRRETDGSQDRRK